MENQLEEAGPQRGVLRKQRRKRVVAEAQRAAIGRADDGRGVAARREKARPADRRPGGPAVPDVDVFVAFFDPVLKLHRALGHQVQVRRRRELAAQDLPGFVLPFFGQGCQPIPRQRSARIGPRAALRYVDVKLFGRDTHGRL